MERVYQGLTRQGATCSHAQVEAALSQEPRVGGKLVKGAPAGFTANDHAQAIAFVSGYLDARFGATVRSDHDAQDIVDAVQGKRDCSWHAGFEARMAAREIMDADDPSVPVADDEALTAAECKAIRTGMVRIGAQHDPALESGLSKLAAIERRQLPSVPVTDEMAIQVWRDTHAGRQPYRAEVKTMRDALEAALNPA